MRVFVTGASGFIGGKLCPALMDSGSTVLGLTRGGQLPNGVEVIRGDIEDPFTYNHALLGVDAVVHCAALVDPIDDETRANAVNHLATVKLANACASAGVK